MLVWDHLDDGVNLVLIEYSSRNMNMNRKIPLRSRDYAMYHRRQAHGR